MGFRYDAVNLRRAPKRTSTGSLHVEGAITRTGVFVYRRSDGSVSREYRPPEEVFRPESLASFGLVPVTDDHPSVPLDASNITRYARGTSGEIVRQDGSHVVTTIVVHDADLIGKIEGGVRQLSCGYSCREDRTPGISPEGEPYDLIQRDIVGDHIAVVQRGRAGSAELRLDSAVEVNDNGKETGSMEELAKALASLKVAEADVAAQRARADRAEAELASARKDVESLDRRVADRADLIAVAATVLKLDDGKSVDVVAMSDRAIRVAVVAKIDKEDLSDGARYSDDYVRAAYDGAVKRARRGAESLASTVSAAGAPKTDSEDLEAKATRAMNERRNKAAFAKEGN